MKKVITIIASCLIFSDFNPVFCETSQSTESLPSTVSFSACQKIYLKQSEPFFYIVLSSVSKNNYKVEEIQSKNGLIIFKAYNKEFLANITKVDAKTTLLKITPADNNYNFSYSLLDNLFKTIDTDLWQDIYKLN